jgi:cytochrome c553
MKALKSLAVAAMLLIASAAVAAAPTKPVVLPAKSGAVTFNHSKHPAVKCTQCHADDKGGKIAGLDKDKGHAMCHECHKKEGKGPQKCAECHKK